MDLKYRPEFCGLWDQILQVWVWVLGFCFKPVSAEMIRGLGFIGAALVSGRGVVGGVNVSFIF